MGLLRTHDDNASANVLSAPITGTMADTSFDESYDGWLGKGASFKYIAASLVMSNLIK